MDASTFSSVVPCLAHPLEHVVCFCSHPCNQLVCWLCQQTTHKGHNFKDLHEVGPSVKRELVKCFQKCEKSGEELQSQLKVNKTSLKQLAESENELRRTLKDYTVSIGKLLRETAGKVMKSAVTIANVRREELNKSGEQLKLSCEELEHVARFLKEALERGSPAALLAASHLLQQRSYRAQKASQRLQMAARSLCDEVTISFKPRKNLDLAVAELGSIVSGTHKWNSNQPLNSAPDFFRASAAAVHDSEVTSTNNAATSGAASTCLSQDSHSQPASSTSKQVSNNVTGTLISGPSGGSSEVPVSAFPNELHMRVLRGEVLINDSQQEKYNFSSQHQEDDPYEDYCSVCHDGGDLLCCDGDECNRVYHLKCHLPELSGEPEGLWTCTMCKPASNFKENEKELSKKRLGFGLSSREVALAQRILLDLYCQPNSQVFHLPVPEMTPNYRKVISQPMDFATIRSRLESQKSDHYETMEDFILDVNLVFDNCVKFNGMDSSLGKIAEHMRSLLSRRIRELIPRLSTLTSDEPQPKKARVDEVK